jgi:transposase
MYSKDLRKRVMSLAKKKGASEASRVFNVSRGCVYRWMKQPVAEKTGPKGAHKLDIAKLNALLAERNDRYQDELAELLGVHKSTICKAIKRMNWSHKKNEGAPQVKYT